MIPPTEISKKMETRVKWQETDQWLAGEGSELQQNTKELEAYGNVILLTAVQTDLWVNTDNDTNQLLYFKYVQVFYVPLKIKRTINIENILLN